MASVDAERLVARRERGPGRLQRDRAPVALGRGLQALVREQLVDGGKLAERILVGHRRE